MRARGLQNMKTLERRYSKTDRIIAKAYFSSAVYLRNLLVAVILGGIIGVLWGFNAQIEKLVFKHESVIWFTDDIMKWVLVGAAGFVLVGLILRAISIYAKELIVTEDKLAVRKGFLSVVNDTIPLSKIVNIETKQRLLQRLFNFGTITVYSDGLLPITVSGVKAVDRLSRRILKQVDAAKREAEGRRMQLQLAQFVPKHK